MAPFVCCDRTLKTWNGGTEQNIGKYESNHWYNIKLVVNATANGNYDLYLDNKKVLEKALLTEAVTSVERISFSTGTYRNHPDRKTPNQVPPPLAGADEKQEVVTYFIDNFKADSMN